MNPQQGYTPPVDEPTPQPHMPDTVDMLCSLIEDRAHGRYLIGGITSRVYWASAEGGEMRTRFYNLIEAAAWCVADAHPCEDFRLTSCALHDEEDVERCETTGAVIRGTMVARCEVLGCEDDYEVIEGVATKCCKHAVTHDGYRVWFVDTKEWRNGLEDI